MIEYVLVFLLGMLVAGLIWLILLPAFWRRAVRLTTQRLEQALPLSPNEIAAEKDRLRAEHGVAVARLNGAVERVQRDLVMAKSETGERLKAEAGLLDTLAGERRRLAALEAEASSLRVDVQTRDVRIADLLEARTHARAAVAELEAQRDDLTARLNVTVDLAENRRLQLDEARVHAERAREALEEEAHRNTQLRNELQFRQTELREAARRLETAENQAVLARIRGGEETYQSVASIVEHRQAG
jgi:chromosome segregation ATPase